MTEKEIIKELEKKIKELQDVIAEVLQAQKSLAKISAGPFESEGNIYYRAVQGESPLIATYKGNMLFDKTKSKKDIKIGTEVLLINGLIIDILPEALFAKEPAKNTFKLIEWNEIGGLESQIAKIKEAVETPLKNSELAKEFGLEPIKGILLYGPPGCGKTLVAKAIASTILKDSKANDDSFIYIKAAELLSMYVGATEQRIIQMFKSCRAYSAKSGKRAVIFIDEAEAILPMRGSRRSSDVDKTIVPTFLSEMDGFDDHSPIVILSTNLPDAIDTAVLREGRIDLKIGIERPTQPDTQEIFGIHLKKVKCAGKIEDMAKDAAHHVHTSVKHKLNVSGAMVQAVVKLATQKALTRAVSNPKDKHPGVIGEDITEALKLL